MFLDAIGWARSSAVFFDFLNGLQLKRHTVSLLSRAIVQKESNSGSCQEGFHKLRNKKLGMIFGPCTHLHTRKSGI